MTRAAVATAFLALLGSTAAAGPWAMGAGRLYAKASHGRLQSTELASPDGSVSTIPSFRKEETSVFVAYGLSSRLTAMLSVPLWRSSDLEGFRRESGVGDISLGLQAQLAQRGPWVSAVRVSVQAPTGDETRAEGLLPTGSGAWEGEAVLGAGRSLAGGKLYGFAEVGHQLRGSGLTDSLVYGAQLGWNARPWLVLAGNVRGVHPYDSSAPREAFGSPVGVSDRVSYVAWGPTAIVKASDTVAFQVDVENASRARNLARGVTLRAGIAVTPR